LRRSTLSRLLGALVFVLALYLVGVFLFQAGMDAGERRVKPKSRPAQATRTLSPFPSLPLFFVLPDVETNSEAAARVETPPQKLAQEPAEQEPTSEELVAVAVAAAQQRDAVDDAMQLDATPGGAEAEAQGSEEEDSEGLAAAAVVAAAEAAHKAAASAAAAATLDARLGAAEAKDWVLPDRTPQPATGQRLAEYQAHVLAQYEQLAPTLLVERVREGLTLCCGFGQPLQPSPGVVLAFRLQSSAETARVVAHRDGEAWCATLRALPRARFAVQAELYNASLALSFDLGNHSLPAVFAEASLEESRAVCGPQATDAGFWRTQPSGRRAWVSTRDAMFEHLDVRMTAYLRSARVWIQLVGDSVLREQAWALCSLLRLEVRQMWNSGRNSAHPDAVECSSGALGARSVITFQWLPWMLHGDGPWQLRDAEWREEVADITWGAHRRRLAAMADVEGRRPGEFRFNSSFMEAKTPRLTLFSLGYHYAHVDDDAWRAMLRATLGSALPRRRPFLYLLHVLPDAQRIPDKYEHDVQFRSLARTVARNEAAAAEACARSAAGAPVGLVDLFSVELPVHEMAHRDAIHLTERATRAMAQQALRGMAMAMGA